MKKHILSVLALVLLAQWSYGNVIQGVAEIPDGYYDGVSGKKTPDAILEALRVCISKGYNEINYKGLESHYQQTDFYADTLWDVYSTCRFTYDMANIPQKNVCDGWNKEHVCCQSWLGDGPMVSDMFNVYPTDARVNNLRSNYPYGVVENNKGFSNDPEHHALGKLGTSSAAGTTVYEPDDKYKGDLARTFFYMVARYRNKTLNNSKDGKIMFLKDKNDNTNLTDYSLSFLLQWHRQDPVSEKEIDRNQGVYGEQKNRNPFIDYPELVEYIWGDKVGQTVDLSSLVPTCDGGTPLVPKPKFGVDWFVNGMKIQVDSVIQDKNVQALPEEPTSCSSESNTFVGWTTTPIEGTSDEAPAVLYASASEIPAIIANTALYAVFAHSETEETGVVAHTETFDFVGKYSNGEEVKEVTQGDVTITFGKGTAQSNVPKYYNTGTAIRCYPKNTITVEGSNMTQIDFTFGSGDSNNPITADVGTFTNTRWTGAADKVVFTIGGSSNHRRIAGMAVTTNGESAITTYDRYITSCQTTEEFENVVSDAPARKILIGGQIYILVGETIYTITGIPVSQINEIMK